MNYNQPFNQKLTLDVYQGTHHSVIRKLEMMSEKWNEIGGDKEN
jgi:hypothetical protein